MKTQLESYFRILMPAFAAQIDVVVEARNLMFEHFYLAVEDLALAVTVTSLAVPAFETPIAGYVVVHSASIRCGCCCTMTSACGPMYIFFSLLYMLELLDCPLRLEALF